MEEHKDVNTRLEENFRAKWPATIHVKIELVKNLDKIINSYIGSEKFPNLSLKRIFKNGAET